MSVLADKLSRREIELERCAACAVCRPSDDDCDGGGRLWIGRDELEEESIVDLTVARNRILEAEVNVSG